MSVKFVILGLLLKAPCHPYKLSIIFKERIGCAWELNRGQVYQTVYRLEEDGLVESRGCEPNGRGVKCTYHITESGRKEYERWRMSSAERARPLRDDLLLKIAMAMPKDADHLLGMIDRREQMCAERLQEYTEFEADLVPLDEARCWEDVGPTLSTNAALAQLNSEMAWLAEARITLMRLRDEARSVQGAAQQQRPQRAASQAG